MKRRAFVFGLLILAGTWPARADNLLKNGDFSEGVAHWSGDAVAPSSDDHSAAPIGVKIPLHAHTWVCMFQELQLPRGAFHVGVNLTFSSDLTFSDQYVDYIGLPQKIGFKDKSPLDGETGDWTLLVAGSNGKVTYQNIKRGDLGVCQSADLSFKNKNDRLTKWLFLAFPPGTGSVLVQQVTLSP